MSLVGIELGWEDNIHSSQPFKINQIDLYLVVFKGSITLTGKSIRFLGLAGGR